MTEQTKSDLISKIIKLEYEITSAIIDGHKPSINDKFKKWEVSWTPYDVWFLGTKVIFVKKICEFEIIC